MSKKKTNKEFIEEMKIKNPSIISIEEYINTHAKIKVKCKICGNIWEASPTHLLDKNHRTGCPICNNKKRNNNLIMPKNVINQKIKEISNGDYYIKDWLNYRIQRDKVLFCHKKCGNEFEMTVNNFFNGQRCPVHKYENLPQKFTKKPHEYYKQRIITECPDYKDYQFLQKMNNGIHGKIKIKHKKCGHIFEMSPLKFLSGERCKYCCDIYNSKGIKRIKNFLENHDIQYEVEKNF